MCRRTARAAVSSTLCQCSQPARQRLCAATTYCLCGRLLAATASCAPTACHNVQGSALCIIYWRCSADVIICAFLFFGEKKWRYRHSQANDGQRKEHRRGGPLRTTPSGGRCHPGTPSYCRQDRLNAGCVSYCIAAIACTCDLAIAAPAARLRVPLRLLMPP